MIFIVGVGRSGTSLLQSMLNAHKDIVFLPEISFIRRYLAAKNLDNLFKVSGANKIIDLLGKDKLLKRLNLCSGELKEIIDVQGDKFTSFGLYKEILAAYIAKFDKLVYVGDKDPKCIEFLPLIKNFFPKAYVLHIYRDPRDVLLSKTKADWSKTHSVLYHIFAYRVQMKMATINGVKYFGSRYKEICYEDLIKDPVTILKSICDLLEIKYDSGMECFSSSSKDLVAKEEMQWKSETLGPLLVNNTGKWKGKLSSVDVALTEIIDYDVFQDLKYLSSEEYSRVSYINRLYMLFIRLMVVVLDPMYRLYRRWGQ